MGGREGKLNRERSVLEDVKGKPVGRRSACGSVEGKERERERYVEVCEGKTDLQGEEEREVCGRVRDRGEMGG